MSWVFMGTHFFLPKSSNAKYSTLETSEANFGGKKKNAYNIVKFMFCAIFSNGRWQPSWNAKLQKYQNGLMQYHWYNSNDIFSVSHILLI